MLTLLFSNKHHLTKGKYCLLDWMCGCVHVPISVNVNVDWLNKQFLTWEISQRGDKVHAQHSFCPFVEQSGIWARLRGGVYPLLSSCPAGSSAVRAMQRRRSWECEVPLAVPGPTMSWLCGMWDMHLLLWGRVGLSRPRKALQSRHERQTNKENRRDSKARRGRLSTDYAI